MGSMAASRVHWLMLLETMFISAVEARVHGARPVEGRNLFREFGDERRHPLHEDEVRHPERRRKRASRLARNGSASEVDQGAAGQEQPGNGGDAHGSGSLDNGARDAFQVVDALRVLRRHAAQQRPGTPRRCAIRTAASTTVSEPFHQMTTTYSHGGDQPDDLDAVLVFQADVPQGSVRCAGGGRTRP